MKKIFLGFLLFLAAAMLCAAAEDNFGAARITIPAGKKPSVEFPHRTHQQVLKDCDLCHFLFPRESGSIVSMKDKGALKKMEVMKNCLGCHKKLRDEGKHAGPVNCKGCHG